uniref:C2H2-type domain-containing protein n=1 Tax=Musca domestica TaxID=7370 RepID=A0A1I8N967_MUSDO
MSQKNSCRLCVKWCEYVKNLYDESGQPNALYEIIAKYFHPTVLNIEKYTYLTGICRQCWIHIKVFTGFQRTIKEAQAILLDSCPEDTNETKLETHFEYGSNREDIQFIITSSDLNIKDEFGEEPAGEGSGSIGEEYLEDDCSSSNAMKGPQQYGGDETNVINIEEFTDEAGGHFENEEGEAILLDNNNENEVNEMELLHLQNEYEQQHLDEINAAEYPANSFSQVQQNAHEMSTKSHVPQELYTDAWSGEIVAEHLPFVEDGSQQPHYTNEGQEFFNNSTATPDTGQTQDDSPSIILLKDEYQLEPAMIFKCKFCGYFWKTKKELKTHVMQQHRDQLYKNKKSNTTPQITTATSSASTSNSTNNSSLLQPPKERPIQHTNERRGTLLKRSHQHPAHTQHRPKRHILNKDITVRVEGAKPIDDFKLLQLECKSCTKCFNSEQEFNSHPCLRTVIKPRIAVGKRTFKLPPAATKMLQNKPQSSSSSTTNGPSWIYACSFCTKSYSTFSELNSHREREHPLERNTKYLKILR